ncbi:MAG: hypothetical protein HYY04_10480 [Chloroflexi bacterium]|nr:hypothetical protein [Chloroflexota bacterium]
MVRTHVVLPDDLVRDIDRLVGKRRRSEFLAAAAYERIRRLALGETLIRGAGILKEKDYPHWATPEKVSAWVSALRQIDAERSEEALSGRPAGETEPRG